MKKKMIVSSFMFAGFLVLAAGSFDDERTEEEKAESKCKDEIMAYVMSQTFVKRALKSPSTAEFPRGEYKTQYMGECRHKIWGKVDAQNGFGAMIRSSYYVELKYNKDDKNWYLLDIQM